MDELLEQFVIEGRELVQDAAQGITALASGDAASLDGAARAFHTLKGSAAIFGFAALESVLHAAEDLTDTIRTGRTPVTSGVIDPLLDTIGAVERWIEAIARAGTMPDQVAAEAPALIARLSPLAPDSGARPPAADGAAPDWLPALLARPRSGGGDPITALRYRPTEDCFFRGDDPLALLRGVPGLVAVDVRLPPQFGQAALRSFKCHLVIEALSTAPAADIRSIFRFVPDQVEIVPVVPHAAGPAAAASPAAPRERTIRVDVARIEHLADIAGELLVAKNRLGHLTRLAQTDPAGAVRTMPESVAALDRLVRDLHRAVAAARMVRLDHTLQVLPRLVRETAGRLGRAVALDLQGGGTQADKRIADGLFEPLLHTVRNAIDHGIEPPSSRTLAGKPAEGSLVVHARQSGDRLVIDVTDDGAGIDPAAIRDAAVARGLIGAEAASSLDEAAAVDLLFTPGFSTASSVSAVSGRGVGLDAVRTSIAALGGRVEILSRLGAGTTVRFTIPQTAVLTTLVQVAVGGEVFGIPIDRVAELLHLPAAGISVLADGAAFDLRGGTVPLLMLARLLGLPAPGRGGQVARVVVVRCGAELVGFEVDGFGERFDAVVRPSHGLLAGMPGLLGNVLLGDGTIMLVLDLAALVP